MPVRVLAVIYYLLLLKSLTASDPAKGIMSQHDIPNHAVYSMVGQMLERLDRAEAKVDGLREYLGLDTERPASHHRLGAVAFYNHAATPVTC